MSGKTDVVKGRIKEAAGALTGNDKLREEGKTDQAVGKAKQAVQEAADNGKESREKSDRVIEESRDAEATRAFRFAASARGTHLDCREQKVFACGGGPIPCCAGSRTSCRTAPPLSHGERIDCLSAGSAAAELVVARCAADFVIKPKHLTN